MPILSLGEQTREIEMSGAIEARGLLPSFALQYRLGLLDPRKTPLLEPQVLRQAPRAAGISALLVQDRSHAGKRLP